MQTLLYFLSRVLILQTPIQTKTDEGPDYHVGYPTINAYAYPGGYIYFCTGLLELLESEAEIMTVLGHEMGHIDNRHTTSLFQYVKAMGLWDRESGFAMVLIFKEINAFMSTTQEFESDAFAFNAMYNLGYSPHRAVLVFKKLETLKNTIELEGSFANILLSETIHLFETHPPDRMRQCAFMDEIRLRDDGQDTIFYVGKQNFRNLIPKSQRTY